MTELHHMTADGPVPFTPEEVAEYLAAEAAHAAAALSRLIDARCAEIEAERDRRLSACRHDFGPPHGVLTLQLRDLDDRTNWLTLDGAATKLAMSGQGGALLPMRTAENATLQLPATEVMQVLAAMAAYGSAVMAASWAHKDAIRALTDPEGVAGYDITAGWPA